MINGILSRKGCPADKNIQISDVSCLNLIPLTVIPEHMWYLHKSIFLDEPFMLSHYRDYITEWQFQFFSVALLWPY